MAPPLVDRGGWGNPWPGESMGCPAPGSGSPAAGIGGAKAAEGGEGAGTAGAALGATSGAGAGVAGWSCTPDGGAGKKFCTAMTITGAATRVAMAKLRYIMATSLRS